MNGQANKTVAGGGVGGALGYLVTIFGPKFGWFTLASADEGAAIATALGLVFAWLARYLPEPK